VSLGKEKLVDGGNPLTLKEDPFTGHAEKSFRLSGSKLTIPGKITKTLEGENEKGLE